MISMLNYYKDKLPPFTDYWKHLFRPKKMTQQDVLDRRSGAQLMNFLEARAEFFDPLNQTNMNTFQRVVVCGLLARKRIRKEMVDVKKVTFCNMDISKGPMSLEHCTDRLLGVMATNDITESALAGVTCGIELGGTIGFKALVADSDNNGNNSYSRPIL